MLSTMTNPIKIGINMWVSDYGYGERGGGVLGSSVAFVWHLESYHLLQEEAISLMAQRLTCGKDYLML
jgi:hypothetical protein